MNSYWDRGLLGFALDPNYATNGRIYVLYTHDTATNAENSQSIANRNATDNCPSPPAAPPRLRHLRAALAPDGHRQRLPDHRRD